MCNTQTTSSEPTSPPSTTTPTTSSSPPSSAAAKSTAPNRNGKPSVSYIAYMYREELKRRRSRHMYKSKTKLLLTDELIARTVNHIGQCSAEDLQILSRETIFKKRLGAQMQRMKRLQHMWYIEKSLKAKSTLAKK